MVSSNENYPPGPYEADKHITPPPRPISPSTAEYQLNHMMIRIKDPEKSMKFYCDCLGMHVIFIFNAGPFTIYYLGPRDVDSSTPYASGNDYPGPGIGLGHLGFTVPDVAEAVERVKSHGFEVIKPLDEAKEEQMGIPADAVAGKHGKVPDGYKYLFKQLAFVKDPDSPLVKVLIGPDTDRSELHIHQLIIAARSEFFASALNGRWNNFDTKIADLYKAAPDLVLEDVAHYLEAVYTNQIDDENHLKRFDDICKVYVVAERLHDVQTRNLAVEALYNRMQGLDPTTTVPGPKCLDIIYEGTVSAKNRMRKLLVDIWCTWDIDQREDYLNTAPRQFLVELAAAAVRKLVEDSEDQELILDVKAYLED
ncbi:hypothetical protein IG631_00705 [Alternaria alternata]|nr:hypothetical protein IG631_00705 [Alternaria alternata]